MTEITRLARNLHYRAVPVRARLRETRFKRCASNSLAVLCVVTRCPRRVMQIEEICLTTPEHRIQIVPSLVLNSRGVSGIGKRLAAHELGEAGESVDLSVVHRSPSSDVSRRPSTARRQSLLAFSPPGPEASHSEVFGGALRRPMAEPLSLGSPE